MIWRAPSPNRIENESESIDDKTRAKPSSSQRKNDRKRETSNQRNDRRKKKTRVKESKSIPNKIRSRLNEHRKQIKIYLTRHEPETTPMSPLTIYTFRLPCEPETKHAPHYLPVVRTVPGKDPRRLPHKQTWNIQEDSPDRKNRILWEGIIIGYDIRKAPTSAWQAPEAPLTKLHGLQQPSQYPFRPHG